MEWNNDGSGNTLVTTFDGQTVSNTDVLVKYTYYGDTDLSGVVDSSDYIAIDNGFNNQLTGWNNGDFNYDGMINGDDYALIVAYNSQGGVSLATVSTQPTEMIAIDTAQMAGSAAVPEPATFSLLIIGGSLPAVLPQIITDVLDFGDVWFSQISPAGRLMDGCI